MQFKNFEIFLEQFKPEYQSIFHLAVTVERYFYFAELQANIFKEKISQMYDRNGDKDFSDTCFSSCFIMYFHVRTCLAANRRLADELKKLNQTQE